MDTLQTNEENTELVMATKLTEKQIEDWLSNERFKKKRATGGTPASVQRRCKE